MRGLGAVPLSLLLAVVPWPAGAQQRPAPAFSTVGRGAASPTTAASCGPSSAGAHRRGTCTDPIDGPRLLLDPVSLAAGRSQRASVWAIAASAIVPGAGQAMLGVDRFIPYLATEAYLWIQFSVHSRDARRERDAYRVLAARVARNGTPASRPNGDFDYYERMKHYAESGRYTLRQDGGLEPETDTTTYNGAMWLLARRTYWPDVNTPPDSASPGWRLAVDFYRRRSYGEPYLWSWGGAPLEYGEFRRLIGRSNDANRKALQDAGVIIANHLLSTVDAFVTVRLRRRPAGNPAGEGWEVEGSLPLSRVAR